ncbi:unnamed protein product [Staurois parvus]|uniref:Uncharacterized protein n=1 Tax=Staurois parvus TaxID=386267 RepID=A0ABN9B991_9NEOB|nr:unnamed protein product [Staurois parvus]
MQMQVLGCTFLTLTDREESAAENRQLSERGSAPIIRVTDHQCPDDQCPAVHTQVLPTCAQQCAHLCHPVVSPPVPRSATYLCPVQCHQSVPSGCASQCAAVPPVSAQQ